MSQQKKTTTSETLPRHAQKQQRSAHFTLFVSQVRATRSMVTTKSTCIFL